LISIHEIGRRYPEPSLLLSIYSIVSLLLLFSAIVLGIIAFYRLSIGAGQLTGKGFAAVGISVPLVTFFLAIALYVGVRAWSTAYRLCCGTNLSGIGKAMLIYAGDYDDELPRVAGPNSKWGSTPNWQAETTAEAYGLNDDDGRASISANFYLLVKYAEVTPKSFVCIRDEGTSEFTLAKYKIRNKDLADLWDFGPDPSKHCSYTYHIPYGPYPLTTSSDPGLAVAADRNPWLDAPGRRARSVTDLTFLDPKGPRELVRHANSISHKEDGQNVLFADGHTDFEKDPFCGVNNDNIYTSHNDTDIQRGIPPPPQSQPAAPNDSLLLHDPPKGAAR